MECCNIAIINISLIFFYIIITIRITITTRILIIVGMIIIIVRYGGLGVVELPNSNGTDLLSRLNLRLRLIIMIMMIISNMMMIIINDKLS